MEPERENGNVEYKWKLVNKTESRVEQLATQMRYRCDEGSSECIYNIGVEDDGTMTGITEQEYEETIGYLTTAATKNNYSITLLTTTSVENGRNIYEVLVREKNENSYIDIKVAVAGSVDVGKCLSPDTPVIKYNGETVNIDMIKKGDFLMGDDSSPREVLKIYQGNSDMYEIQQTRGDNYKVTANHILTLNFSQPCIRKLKDKFAVIWHSGNGNIIKEYFDTQKLAKNHISSVPNVETLDISVVDYIKKSSNWKAFFLGYAVPVSFPERDIKIDPYLLGIWLGDRCSSSKPTITKISRSCEMHNCTVKRSISYSITGNGNNIIRSSNKKRHIKYFSVNKYGFDTAKQNAIDFLSDRTTSNPFWDMIEYYNLNNNNKHIPDDYLYNTRYNRLALLAGLIDSDGYLYHNTYEIVQKNETLALHIKKLCQSLGFKVYYKTISKKCHNSPIQKSGTYYRITFSGENLGVILPCKTANEYKSNVKSLLTTIKVTKIEYGPYYGFELDKNGRFLLGDCTVTHNSSFIGVLTTGKNDNGRGSARLNVFNYPHEVKTGRTSSIGHHILGFDAKGNISNYQKTYKPSWPEIVKNSSKVISFFDLAGHEKYLKTTIMGLASVSPELCLIMVSANRGVIRMTSEHIFLCLALHIPFAVIITKIDMVEEKKNVLKETMNSITQILRCPGIRRIPLKVETHGDIVRSAMYIHTESIVPIFHVSNVTGEGTDKIKKFLNLLPKHRIVDHEAHTEYHIDQSWSVTGVGTVVGGNLISGTVNAGDKLFLGPILGKYEQVVVKSIQCKRVPLQNIDAGSYVTLALRNVDRKVIRKGYVLLSHRSQHLVCQKFVANIKVFRSHSTTIRIGYVSVIHVSTVRSCVKLEEIRKKQNARNPERTTDDNILRTGDIATVVLGFCYGSEFVKPGMHFILAEDRTKVIGTIEELIE